MFDSLRPCQILCKAEFGRVSVTSNFLEIVFRLYECEHYRCYAKAGYDSVCDYALSEPGFKKQIYEHYEENKSVGKLATFIKDEMMKIKSGGVIFDDGSYVSLKAISNFTE